MSKKYVVLGAGGCFGVQTCKYLLSLPASQVSQVVGIGRNPEKHPAFSLRVGEGDSRYHYEQVHIVHEQDRLFDVLDKVEPHVIISYAAQGEGALSWKRAWRYFDTNCTGLVKTIEGLMERDYLERFIQIGTSELYGSVNFAAKETTELKPSSPYAVSKAAFDMYLESVSKVLDFPMNIIRPSNAYCPGQYLHRIIPKAAMCGLKNEKLPLHGGGKARKSYIYAWDLARAIHMVAEKAPLGKVYNVGPKNPIAIHEVVRTVAQVMNIPFDDLVEIAEDRLGEDSQYWLDSSAIENDLGWKQEISLEQGIGEVVQWCREYFDYLKTQPTNYTVRT